MLGKGRRARETDADGTTTQPLLNGSQEDLHSSENGHVLFSAPDDEDDDEEEESEATLRFLFRMRLRGTAAAEGAMRAGRKTYVSITSIVLFRGYNREGPHGALEPYLQLFNQIFRDPSASLARSSASCRLRAAIPSDARTASRAVRLIERHSTDMYSSGLTGRHSSLTVQPLVHAIVPLRPPRQQEGVRALL